MILGEGVNIESVKASFAALSDFFVPYTDPSDPGADGGLTVVDCWTAELRTTLQAGGWAMAARQRRCAPMLGWRGH